MAKRAAPVSIVFFILLVACGALGQSADLLRELQTRRFRLTPSAASGGAKVEFTSGCSFVGTASPTSRGDSPRSSMKRAPL